MNSKNVSFLPIALILLFGGLALALYAIGQNEVAVVPTIGAVCAAVVTIVRATGKVTDDGSTAGDTCRLAVPGPAAPADDTAGAHGGREAA